MAYTRVVCNLTLDNAHADGRITEQGIGRDWEAREPRGESLTGFTPDVASQWGWLYEGRFEYIDRLGCLAPLGGCTPADMALANWTVTQGVWRESETSGVLRYKHLHYYDGRGGRVAGGDWGIVTSNGNYTPNLQLWLWRFPSASGEADLPFVGLRLTGAGGAHYLLGLPAQGAQDTYYGDLTGGSGAQLGTPYVLGRPAGETTWTRLDALAEGPAPQSARLGNEPTLQMVRLEWIADTLLVRLGDYSNVWALSGEWESAGGRKQNLALEEGPVQVIAAGHPIMFLLAQLVYPTAADVYPRPWFLVPGGFNQTPAYRLLTSLGTNTSLSATAHPVGPNRTKPKVSFASTDGKFRGALYCVQEYRTATIGDATSSPVSSATTATFRLMEASGTVNDNWRGSSVTARVEADPGQALADVKANSKAVVTVSTDDGVSTETLFTGYVVPPDREVPGGIGQVVGTLRAEDIVEARLQRKCLAWHSSYENWPVDEAFEHILNRAGVPAALISVEAGITGNLPTGSAKGARKLRFAPDIRVPQALDTIAEVRGLEWGVGADGVVFLRELVEYGGTPDFTLAAPVGDVADMLHVLHAERSAADFRNWLMVMVGEGQDAAVKVLQDETSFSDAAAETFIGDLWQQVEMLPDGDDVEGAAERLWEAMSRFRWLVSWEMHDHPELMPDMFVAVDVSGSQIPAGSVYRIISKSWRAQASGEYWQRLQAVLVQEAT